MYVIAPSPVPSVLLVNAAGSPELQMVWLEPILPAVGTDWTVTVITFEGTDWHATVFKVETVIRL